MSDRKKEPETVSSTVSTEQSQRTKKCKKKMSNNPRQNIQKNLSVQDDMQQMSSVSFPKPSPKREFNIVSDLKEFPQLVRKDHEVRSSQFQKSWRSYVSCQGNGMKDLNETLPKVPDGNCKKKNDDLIGIKNEPQKTSYKQEKPVVDKADNRTSKTEGRLKPDINVRQTQSVGKTQTKTNPTKKKRADPVLINLHEILKVNSTHRTTKQHKVLKRLKHRFLNKDSLSGNILDSSNPKRNKGKHREVKKEKLSNLKLVILKERIIKQKLKSSQVYGIPECSYSDLVENINFKEEIAKYLKELNEKKIKMKEASKNKSKPNTQTDVKNETVEEKVIENKDEHQKAGCLKEKNDCSLDKSNVGSVSTSKEEKETIFSCKMREYCENIITPELNSAVTQLVKEVVSLQDKLYARDPVKAKAKRRHVSGFREVKKFLNLKKVKMIVIPPNLEKLQMKGSIFDLISELKEMANIQNVPYVFALDRYKLGKCTRKNVPVGAFAVLNYEGLEDRFKNVLEHLQEARQQFADVMSKTTAKIEGEDTTQDIQQTGDTVLKTVKEDEKESKENPDEDVSQSISSFLTSLRELSTKSKQSVTS